MQPFELLDMVDGLSRLDPVRTYPERAGQLMARLCGADGFVLELEGTEGAVSEGPREGRVQVPLPLRYGRQAIGQISLTLPAGKERLELHDLRTARWASRIVARCLSYSTRMRQEARKTEINLSDVLQKCPLTPRERDVVGLLVSGASTRQIASETHLTVGTVHTYLKRIYPKMGVRSRVELVARTIGTRGLTFHPIDHSHGHEHDHDHDHDQELEHGEVELEHAEVEDFHVAEVEAEGAPVAAEEGSDAVVLN